MPIDNKKIGALSHPITGLPTMPNTQYSDEELKAYFDGSAVQIKTAFNALIDFLKAATAGDSGAANIGSEAIADVSGTTVREQLYDLKRQLNDVVLGQIPEGSIDTVSLKNGAVTDLKIAPYAVTTEKLADEAVDNDKLAAGAALANLGAGTVTLEKLESLLQMSVAKVGDYKWRAMSSALDGWLLCNGAAVSRATYADLFDYLVPLKGNPTISIASPGVVTLNGHGLQTGDQVYFTTTGALPTGLSVNTIYFVVRVNDNTFNLAASYANAMAASPTRINTSGSQSGTHSMRHCPYGLGDGSTTFNLPPVSGRAMVGVDTAQKEFAAAGQRDGAKTHTLTQAELPNVTISATNPVPGKNMGVGWAAGAGGSFYNPPTLDTTLTMPGGGQSHNNLQPYITGYCFIKY